MPGLARFARHSSTGCQEILSTFCVNRAPDFDSKQPESRISAKAKRVDSTPYEVRSEKARNGM